MKQYLCCSLLVLLGCAYPNFLAAALNVTCSVATFQTPEGKTFTEVYTHYIATDFRYKPLIDSSKMASVAVIFLFKQGETIIQFDKFLLTSPVTAQHANQAILWT